MKKIMKALASLTVLASSAAYAAAPIKTASFPPQACAKVPRTLWMWDPTSIRDCYADGYEDWR